MVICKSLCYNINVPIGGYSSAGRAIRSQRIGHEFESRYLHYFLLVKAENIKFVSSIYKGQFSFEDCPFIKNRENQ